MQKIIERRNLEILADLKRMTALKVALKHGISPQRVYQILNDTRVGVPPISSNLGQGRKRGSNGKGKDRTT